MSNLDVRIQGQNFDIPPSFLEAKPLLSIPDITLARLGDCNGIRYRHLMQPLIPIIIEGVREVSSWHVRATSAGIGNEVQLFGEARFLSKDERSMIPATEVMGLAAQWINHETDFRTESRFGMDFPHEEGAGAERISPIASHIAGILVVSQMIKEEIYQ